MSYSFLWEELYRMVEEFGEFTPEQKALCTKWYESTRLPDYTSSLRGYTNLPEVLIKLILEYTEVEVETKITTVNHEPRRSRGVYFPPKRITLESTCTLLWGIPHGPYVEYKTTYSMAFDRTTQTCTPIGALTDPTLSEVGCYHEGRKIGLREDSLGYWLYYGEGYLSWSLGEWKFNSGALDPSYLTDPANQELVSTFNPVSRHQSPSP